ncbi:MAG: hypothetical protein GY847_05890 [Proteobacteria bacterium]|nr:hypothetical protein [Pseudomonadota bacterium]
MNKFLYQANQNINQTWSHSSGVFDKGPEITALQNLILYVVKGISMYANRTRKMTITDREVDHFAAEALFYATTCDPVYVNQLSEILKDASKILHRAKTLYEWACAPYTKSPEKLGGPATWKPAFSVSGLISQGKSLTPKRENGSAGRFAEHLEDLCILGLKETASYAAFIRTIGRSDDEIYSFFHDILDTLVSKPNIVKLEETAERVRQANLSANNLLNIKSTRKAKRSLAESVKYKAALGI